jgi:hypothetical protein
MPPPYEGFSGRITFRRLLAQAIAEISEAGYVSSDQIEMWIARLRNAAEQDLGPEGKIDAEVNRSLQTIFDRLIERGKIFEYVPEVSRFTLAIIRPKLHAELDRRIAASVNKIKLNRREAVDRTLSRFQGWSTSIPAGGDDTIDKIETRTEIGKSVARVRYERALVDRDQGHKLIANIADIVATDAGAIAGVWHDHGEHDPSYDARKEHMARAGKTYLIRNSWAHQQGLVRAPNGFVDEYEMVGQAVSCRCWYKYITSPRRLPDGFLTKKGQEWIALGAQRRPR